MKSDEGLVVFFSIIIDLHIRGQSHIPCRHMDNCSLMSLRYWIHWSICVNWCVFLYYGIFTCYFLSYLIFTSLYGHFHGHGLHFSIKLGSHFEDSYMPIIHHHDGVVLFFLLSTQGLFICLHNFILYNCVMSQHPNQEQWIWYVYYLLSIMDSYIVVIQNTDGVPWDSTWLWVLH